MGPVGTGMFHCGLEVFGTEWSFANTYSGTGCGIYADPPRCCEYHTYDDSVSMGETEMSEAEVRLLIKLLANVWRAESYSTLHNNCCHFANELSLRLGVGP